MPPIIRYTKDAVLAAAFKLVRHRGLTALNARAVAQELGSSTQPIFRLFSGMDELRDGVFHLAQQTMADYLFGAIQSSDTPYLTLGIAYVRFAQEESELFKVLFMQNQSVDMEQLMPLPDELLKLVQEQTGFSARHSKILHGWLWIFTHGLAVCVATQSCCISEERLPRILIGAYEAAALKMQQDIEANVV